MHGSQLAVEPLANAHGAWDPRGCQVEGLGIGSIGLQDGIACLRLCPVVVEWNGARGGHRLGRDSRQLSCRQPAMDTSHFEAYVRRYL